MSACTTTITQFLFVWALCGLVVPSIGTQFSTSGGNITADVCFNCDLIVARSSPNASAPQCGLGSTCDRLFDLQHTVSSASVTIAQKANQIDVTAITQTLSSSLTSLSTSVVSYENSMALATLAAESTAAASLATLGASLTVSLSTASATATGTATTLSTALASNTATLTTITSALSSNIATQATNTAGVSGVTAQLVVNGNAASTAIASVTSNLVVTGSNVQSASTSIASLVSDVSSLSATTATKASVNAVNGTMTNLSSTLVNTQASVALKANTVDLVGLITAFNALQTDYIQLKAVMANCTALGKLTDPVNLVCINAVNPTLVSNLTSVTSLVQQMTACQSRDPATVYDTRLGGCTPYYTLQDVNECTANTSGCQQNCTNTIGGFYCSCQSGYTLDTNGRTCTDVNECLTNNGGCSANAQCVNTPGQFYCLCNPGYTGNGFTCNTCPIGQYQPAQANQACFSCPASATTAAAGSSVLSACYCPAGYTGNASQGQACTACAVDTYKSVTGPSACVPCTFGWLTGQTGSTSNSQCDRVQWMNAGTLGTWNTVVAQYSTTQYEFGISWNGATQLVRYNMWNKGYRVTLYPFLPQGDTSTSLSWGTVVFTRDLTDQTPGVWQHNYYRVAYNGVASFQSSNSGNMDTVVVYVRPLYTQWINAGLFANFDAIRANYSDLEYEYGVSYNGALSRAFINQWNVGIRVSLYPFYPQGDVSTTLTFGTTVITRGLNGAANANLFYANYYTWPWTLNGGNGDITNSVSVFVRRHINPWVLAGPISSYTTISSTYPSNTYELGMVYNGGVQPIFANGWNAGIRVTAYPFYPMGDVATSLTFGTVVVTKGTNDITDKNNWYFKYYAMNQGNSFNDAPLSSYGGMTNPSLYYRPIKFPWTQVGTLGDYVSILANYPTTKFEFGGYWNGYIQPMTFNDWNSGKRASLTPIYPMGDDSTAFTFGTTVFTTGLSDQTGSDWYQRYYNYPSTNAGGGWTATTQPVYARPFSSQIFPIGFGV